MVFFSIRPDEEDYDRDYYAQNGAKAVSQVTTIGAHLHGIITIVLRGYIQDFEDVLRTYDLPVIMNDVHYYLAGAKFTAQNRVYVSGMEYSVVPGDYLTML